MLPRVLYQLIPQAQSVNLVVFKTHHGLQPPVKGVQES